MQYTSETIERLIKEFSKLPGIGRKTAQRLVFHLLKQPKDEVVMLSQALLDMKEKIGRCTTCFNVTEHNPCPICANPRRDHGVICVVEEANDVLAIERTDMFRGVYHVLGGLLNPLEGVGPDDLRIRELIQRSENEVREMILAINPTVPGDATVMFVAEKMQGKSVRLTRIARGIPIGSDLEFADMTTLTRALEGRVSV
ncbi:recombination mediator RecR [bacterium]|nr:recombination mediator RecR [bacterium]NUN44545.1 recombination protein RecR [bacterium]